MSQKFFFKTWTGINFLQLQVTVSRVQKRIYYWQEPDDAKVSCPDLCGAQSCKRLFDPVKQMQKLQLVKLKVKF